MCPSVEGTLSTRKPSSKRVVCWASYEDGCWFLRRIDEVHPPKEGDPLIHPIGFATEWAAVNFAKARGWYVINEGV